MGLIDETALCFSEAAKAYAEGYEKGLQEGVQQGYEQAVREYLDEAYEPVPEVDEDELSVADQIYIDRIRHDYARNRDYYNLEGDKLA